MKKIINSLKKAFTFMARVIDKKIVIPVTKLFIYIKDNLNRDNKRIEKFINRKSSLLFITLILSLAIFVTVDSKSTIMLENSAEVLYNQKVTTIYNEEAYVLQGIPRAVDVTLIGRSSDLFLAKQIQDNEITIDLTGLKAGTHKVQLKYKKALNSITYKLDPSTVTVTILPKVSETRTVSVDLLNKDDLDKKLIISKTSINRDEVIIKDSSDNLKKVAIVKALVDIDSIVNPAAGVSQIKNIPLIAYDKDGKVVNVEIVPSRVDANVTIESPSKVVPLKVMPRGTVTFGKAISSIDSSVNEVTIYGSEDALSSINNIPVYIDVAGLKNAKEYNVNLTKPSGVSYMSSSIATINVTIDDETSKEFSNINLEYKNLGDNYTVNAKSENDRAVTVIVKGVSSILDTLDANSITAYVDLGGYGPGEHEIDVKVTKSDVRLTYVPKVKKVTLIIKNK